MNATKTKKVTGRSVDWDMPAVSPEAQKTKANAYARAWYAKNAARINAEIRAFRREHPEEARARRRKRYREEVVSGLRDRVAATKIPFGWAKALAARAKTRSRRLGRPCSITWQQLVAIWKRQGGLCAWTGLPMVEFTKSPWTVSVDRRDNALGYDECNVILTTWFANRARGATGEATFGRCLRELGVGVAALVPIDREEVQGA